jgi:hypothetical protein
MGFKARKARKAIRWVVLLSIERPPYDTGATGCVRILKDAGLQGMTGHSPYVGHTSVLVPAGTRRRAARVLGKTVAWVGQLYKYGGFKEEGL